MNKKNDAVPRVLPFRVGRGTGRDALHWWGWLRVAVGVKWCVVGDAHFPVLGRSGRASWRKLG